MPRTFGLDVGDRRIGVAVSDPTRLIARPLSVIDRRIDDAIILLRELVLTHDVDEHVIGMPIHFDGRIGTQAQRVEAFTVDLRQALTIPIHYHDERNSTRTAREIIAAKKRKQRDEHDDAIAASVILQRFLDSRRASDFEDDPADFDDEMNSTT